MKTLILLTTLLTSAMGFASDTTTSECSENDMRILVVTSSYDAPLINQVIQDEIVNVHKTVCNVTTKNIVVPAVCGVTIPDVREYNVAVYKTSYSHTEYKVVVDNSRVACRRSLRIPTLMKFSMDIVIEPQRGSN